MRNESKLGRKVVHLLLVLFALNLGYVLLGLIANYYVAADIFFSLSIVLLLFTLSQAIYEMGTKKAVVFLGVTIFVGFLFEVLGTSSGVPFGKYYYTDFLGTKVLNVPIVVPFVWFVIVYLTFSMCFSYFGEKQSEGTATRVLGLAVLAAFGAVAWDLMVDPMFSSSSYGYWIWENSTSTITLSGVPVSNFIGWFCVTFLMIIFFLFLTRKKQLIVKRNLIDSRIAYVLLLIDATIANANLVHYLVIGLGVTSMLAFLIVSFVVSRAERSRAAKELAPAETATEKGSVN